MSQKKSRNFFPFNIIDRVKEEKRAKKNSKEIDQELRREVQRKRREWNTNIIVTGNSCSGKSTLIQQFKLQKIFTKELDEAIAAMNSLRSHCLELLSNTYSFQCSYAQELSNVDISDGLNFNEYQGLINKFLKEMDGKDCSISDENTNTMTEFQRYLLANFTRILDPQYSITFEDFVVLKKSSFVHMFERDVVTYQVPGNQCNINITQFRIPISGKLKLTSYFEDTDIVLFCSSLQKICHTENSDSIQNQLEEDIEYFKLLAELPCFSDSDFILFLTNIDIFKTMFEKIHLPKDFLDFVSSCQLESHGPDEFCEYIVSKFDNAMMQEHFTGRKLFRYIVNSVNCEDMQKTVNGTLKLIAERSMLCKVCCCPGLL